MNLTVRNPEQFVWFLHAVLLAEGRTVARGRFYRIVETRGAYFFLSDTSVEVGGPFQSVAELIRYAGTRRRGVTEDQAEVYEWDGTIYTIRGAEVRRFPDLKSAFLNTGGHAPDELNRPWLPIPHAGPRIPLVLRRLASPDRGIILLRSTWERLAAIERALRNSRTWAEFRDALPEGVFENLPLWEDGLAFRDEAGLLHFQPPEETDWYEEHPSEVIQASDPFDPTVIPGVTDGDFPGWIAATEEVVLPESFDQRFGHMVDSRLNGLWLEYPLAQLGEMVESLKCLGYDLVAVDLE